MTDGLCSAAQLRDAARKWLDRYGVRYAYRDKAEAAINEVTDLPDKREKLYRAEPDEDGAVTVVTLGRVSLPREACYDGKERSFTYLRHMKARYDGRGEIREYETLGFSFEEY